MKVAEVTILQARLDGIALRLSAAGNFIVKGPPDMVQCWVPRLRDQKESIVQYLQEEIHQVEELAKEFMEVDGLPAKQAAALAEVSVMPRLPSEWLAAIGELDRLIAEYCSLAGLDSRVVEDANLARKQQSLSSIPMSIAWIAREIKRLKEGENGR
jgi:hypothetical protein